MMLTSTGTGTGKHAFISLMILPVTFLSFYFLPQYLGKTFGYLFSFVIYWVYCLLHGWRLKRGPVADLYRRPRPGRQQGVLSLLCFVPAAGAFFAAFLLAYRQLSPAAYAVLIAAALVNGTIEEFYWRGAFTSRYRGNTRWALAFPTVLFGLWHVSVYVAYGITYQGGFAPLVGGAFFMGALWGYASLKQGSILVPAAAHVLTNFLAFSNLIYENWIR